MQHPGSEPWSPAWERALHLWKSPTPALIDDYCTAVGAALRRRRYTAGNTLSEIVTQAQGMGEGEFSAPYLSQLETGATRPSLSRLGLFARLYDVPLPEILQDAERLLARGRETGEGGLLAELHESTARLHGRIRTLFNAYQQGALKHADTCLKIAGEIAPLVDALLRKVGEMEEPGRRPGRPRRPSP